MKPISHYRVEPTVVFVIPTVDCNTYNEFRPAVRVTHVSDSKCCAAEATKPLLSS